MKHTIKLLTLAFMLATILTLTGCPGPVNNYIEPEYVITVNVTNGTALYPTTAKAGESVTITATADEGYILDNANSAFSIPDYSVTNNGTVITWNLVMPASDVTINVVFKTVEDNTTVDDGNSDGEDESPTDEPTDNPTDTNGDGDTETSNGGDETTEPEQTTPEDTDTENGDEEGDDNETDVEDNEEDSCEHSSDYETSGYCELCNTYMYPNSSLEVKVFTSEPNHNAFMKNVLGIGLRDTCTIGNENEYETVKYSFDLNGDNGKEMSVEELLSLKNNYKNKIVVEYVYNGNTYKTDPSIKIDIYSIKSILVRQ